MQGAGAGPGGGIVEARCDLSVLGPGAASGPRLVQYWAWKGVWWCDRSEGPEHRARARAESNTHRGGNICDEKFKSHTYLPDDTGGRAALLPGTGPGGIFSKGGRGGMRGMESAEVAGN